MTLQELIAKARDLRGEADRLAADLRRDNEYPDSDQWKAEALAEAIDQGIKAAEGRALD